MKSSLYLLLGVGVIFMLAISWMTKHRDSVSEFTLSETAKRRATHLCYIYHRGLVQRSELCEKPVPEIPAFTEHYRKLRLQDAEWFQSRGWLYYPEVSCSDAELKVSFMDRLFRCEGAEAVAIEQGRQTRENSGLAYAEAPQEACFKVKTRGVPRVVMEVQNDGTLVLDKKERVHLLGIWVPPIPDDPAAKSLCSQALSFVKSRLENRKIKLFYESDERDERFRLATYVITSAGEFFNHELVRLGLARAAVQAANGSRVACADDLLAAEKAAQNKKLGLWGEKCFEKGFSESSEAASGNPPKAP